MLWCGYWSNLHSVDRRWTIVLVAVLFVRWKKAEDKSAEISEEKEEEFIWQRVDKYKPQGVESLQVCTVCRRRVRFK